MTTKLGLAVCKNAIFTTVVHITIIALIFWPVLIGQKTLIKDFDSADQSFSWLTKVFAAIQQGNLVLWDFGGYSGISFIGELQTGPLYLPALLFGLFATIGEPNSIDLFFTAHLLIAALGMHALAKSFRLPWLAGLGGAVAYSYASLFTLCVGDQGNLFVGLAWIPWAAALAQRSMSVLRWQQAALLASTIGIVIALSFLAGHINSPIYAVFSVCTIVAAPILIAMLQKDTVQAKQIASRALMVTILAILVAMLVSLPQIIAAEEYLRLSYKWYGPGFTSYPHVVPFDQYISYSLQGLDLLALFGIKEGGTKLFITHIGAISVIFVFLLGMSSADRNIKILTIAGVTLSVLALAIGFAKVTPLGWLFYNLPVVNLLRIPSRSAYLFVFAMSFLVMGGLTIICNVVNNQLATRLPQFKSFIGYTTIGLLALLMVIEAKDFAGVTHQPLHAPDAGLTQITDGQVMKALVRLSSSELPVYRYYGPRELVPPNLPNVYPIFSAMGFRSSMPVVYKDYFDFNPTSQRMDLLGVRWWITASDVPGLPLVEKIGDKRIYERPSALPIFSIRTPDGTIIPAPIKKVDWGVNEVTINFSRPIGGRLIFAQTVYPGWIAFANGLSLEVGEDQQLLTVNLPERTNTVTFRYAPNWFVPSVIVAMMTVAMIFFLGMLTLLRVKKYRP